MSKRTITLEFNEYEAVWVWRMADVMNDLTEATEGAHQQAMVNDRLGFIARHVRDELSKQGVTGDGVEAQP